MHPADHETVESTARRNLADALDGAVEPEHIGLDDDLYAELGLTSINKVLLLTSLCDDLDVDLSRFTDEDLAGMTTLRTVLAALERHDSEVAR